MLMMKHRTIWILLLISFFFTSCANIIPPSGGDRDSLPPVLVSAIPKDSAINVSPKLITLTFDEFVSLQDVNSNLIVSPTLKDNPIVDNKLKNVTIKFKDSLEANTTYSLNFGNAIKDVNEVNVIKNFRFVFSTGNTIDNFSYRGKVVLAEKETVDSTLIVLLHNNTSDTAIYKNRPRYFTRINGKGFFEFNNLSGGYYTAYVLPNDFSKKYDDSTKLFAFRTEPLLINSKTITDTFYVFEAFKRKTATTSTPSATTASKTDTRLKYTHNLDNGNQDLLSPLELKFGKPIKKIDSSKLLFTDSGFNPVKPSRISLDSTRTILSLHFPWKEQSRFNLILLKDALEDTAGIGLVKADTLKFITKKETEYSSIRLRFNNINLQKNTILQFIQSDKIIESVPLTSNELIRKLFKSGSFEMRILYDTNKNGVWDTGAFGKVKRQPEIVQLISKPLSVRANWDNEVNIEL